MSDLTDEVSFGRRDYREKARQDNTWNWKLTLITFKVSDSLLRHKPVYTLFIEASDITST